MTQDDVVLLHPIEAVSLDPIAFQALAHVAGSSNAMAKADDMFEDLIVSLSAVERAWASGEFDRLASQAEMLAVLSDNLGLLQCAAIARELSDCIEMSDAVALAAIVARVVRVGEASLTSALEFAYRRI